MNNNHTHQLCEQLAALEHQQWIEWATHIMETEPISDETRKRWQEYMIPYRDIPENIKEKDRHYARKVMAIVNQNT